MRNIETRAELRAFAAEYGLRADWHEPDEVDVSVALAAGSHFDNATSDPTADFALMPDGEDENGAPRRRAVPTEQHAEHGVFLLVNGEAVAAVNLATLFAMACGDVD